MGSKRWQTTGDPAYRYLNLGLRRGFSVLSNTLIEGGIHTDDGVIRHKAAPLFTELKTGLEWQMSDYVAVSASYVVRSPEVDDEGYVWNKHRWGEASLTVRDIGPWGIALTALLLEGIVAYKPGDEDTDDGVAGGSVTMTPAAVFCTIAANFFCISGLPASDRQPLP